MRKAIKILTISVLALSVLACSKKKNNDDPEERGEPGSVQLVFPEDDTECTEGIVINDTQSTVVFQWQEGENVDSYEVNLTNLNTGQSGSANATESELAIVIERGVPYEWFVISRRQDSDAAPKSATWRFFNQGPGVANYAPFPAEAIAPTNGQTITASGNLTLDWDTSDVDNDIAQYEVLFGTDANSLPILGTTTQSMIDVTVNSGQTYYWKVFTEDTFGNISESQVFNFNVQ